MRENVDAAVRPGAGDWPGLESVFLFPAAVSPVCTPEFAKRHRLRRPQDLLAAPRIGLPSDWTAWFAAAGVAGPETSNTPALTATQQTFEVAAAVTGRAATLASPIYFAGELRSGRLVQPFEAMLHFDRGYWLVYREDRRRSAKIAAFRDWILQTIANDPATALVARAPATV
jgi:LysR family glycine cleavage system transcriptional activator